MRKRQAGRHEVSVELTPLIDVVFLLLIFFMVSSTFIRESQVKIDLPEASGELQEVELLSRDFFQTSSPDLVSRQITSADSSLNCCK